MNVKRGRILLVHGEEPQIRDLRRHLRMKGHDARTAADVYSALDLVRSWTPDVAIVEFSGNAPAFQEFTQRLPRSAAPQVIAVLCERPGQGRMSALAAGADDYIASPITIPEVTARIALAMERSSSRQADPVKRVQTDDLLIDFEHRRVVAAGQEQHLAVKEFDVLRCLLLNANRPVQHDELLEAIGGRGGKQNLRVYIRQLRKKLETNAARPRYIRTEARIGYRFDVTSTDIIFS